MTQKITPTPEQEAILQKIRKYQLISVRELTIVTPLLPVYKPEEAERILGVKRGEK